VWLALPDAALGLVSSVFHDVVRLERLICPPTLRAAVLRVWVHAIPAITEVEQALPLQVSFAVQHLEGPSLGTPRLPLIRDLRVPRAPTPPHPTPVRVKGVLRTLSIIALKYRIDVRPKQLDDLSLRWQSKQGDAVKRANA
jgi:hypothetical protein